MSITLQAGQSLLLDVMLTPVDNLTPRPPDESWPEGYATLYGYITKEWYKMEGGVWVPDPQPLEGASVWEGLYGAKSDANGYYVLNSVRDMRHLCPGGWEISCNRTGYYQAFHVVSLAAGDIERLDWHMMARGGTPVTP